MPNIPKRYVERAEAGAEFLDKTITNWWDKIDLSLLDLENPCRCVLGQMVNSKSEEVCEGSYSDFFYDGLYDTKAEVRTNLPKGVKRATMTYPEATSRGFHLDHQEDISDFRLLTRAWKKIINERRAA